MSQIIQIITDIIQAITAVFPYIVQLINAIKGNAPAVQSEALNKALEAAKNHCQGVACATEIQQET